MEALFGRKSVALSVGHSLCSYSIVNRRVAEVQRTAPPLPPPSLSRARTHSLARSLALCLARALSLSLSLYLSLSLAVSLTLSPLLSLSQTLDAAVGIRGEEDQEPEQAFRRHPGPSECVRESVCVCVYV